METLNKYEVEVDIWTKNEIRTALQHLTQSATQDKKYRAIYLRAVRKSLKNALKCISNEIKQINETKKARYNPVV